VAKSSSVKELSNRYEQAEPKFDMTLKSLLNKENVVKRLQFPQKTDRILGAKREAWCEFHQARGHDTKRCLTLKFKLTKLVKEGFLGKYLRGLDVN